MGDQDDFSQLSLPDQFTHKNWKARKGGYETAAKEFKTAQPNDPLVREFILDSGLWKGAVSDSNVAAQQEALGAYNAFLDAAGVEGARKTRGQTVQGVVEKGLTGRPAAKAAAMETLLLLIELDKADPIVDELLPFLSHKQPKLIAATLAALTGIYHSYGCKTVEPKPVIKLLPKVFGHADKNVRAEAQNLTVELYRWLREAMKPLFWGELKEVQQKDLDKLFESIRDEPTPKQERLLRSQQAAQEEAAAAGNGGDGGGAGDDGIDEDGGEIDLEPEYEAVDVFAKVPKDFNDRLASSKWKDRKEALDELLNAVNVPAIQEGPFDDIIRGCAKSMKDANITVVTVAANCVELIAKGLKRSFSRYRSVILAPLLERFKEKKQSVTDAIAAACDAVFMSTSLSEIESDLLEALKSKNPQVKEHTAKFLIRCLKTTRETPSIEQTKEFAEAAKKLLTESVASLRDAGAEILGVLWKIMGDRNMLNHLDGLDDIRKNKIKEFSDAAEVKAKWKPKSAAPQAASKGAAPSAKKPALGTKRPAAPGGVKKAPPPRAATPPPAEEASLQPKPSSKPGIRPPGALRPPGAGLRAPNGSGLAKPGAGLKAPSSGTASPRRQAVMMEDPGPMVPKPGLGGAGRGLAGRPLGKPATAPPSPPPASRPEMGASSALSSIERQELSDLRAELDLLRNQVSDLRQDKMRLTSQIAELQNQNAQLIEDHTRDVLQIKAKETQLVRARSDAENAEERANSLSKEIDRLKREMSRLNRHNGTTSPPLDSQPLYSSFAANSDLAGGTMRPAYGTTRSYNVPSARNYGDVGTAAAEGKENIPDPSSSLSSFDGAVRGGSKLSGGSGPYHPTMSQRPMSNCSSGRATPLSNDGDGSGTGSFIGGSSRGSAGAEQGVESWRRAAEVTQNLKARIEMMKARQNIGRGQ
ncbi:hypothetical protein M433DRAFT_156107 [Acidomyces richmondensis BFW]|nr:MAG: hypothetical protein FE78DRAFT_90722 [Acidomyces sp. 'richmondensis']KYG43989.1 hypothetical protein M433DRAFT_156107 [Acidomyces richmondensis BFW]